MNLLPDGSTEKSLNLNNDRIVGLAKPDQQNKIKTKAVTLGTMNRKILNEIEANSQLESLKYLRVDGENQMVSDLQMNSHKLVGLGDGVVPTDGVNKKTLDAAVISLKANNRRYFDQLILATNETISQKVIFLDVTSLPEKHQDDNGKRITNLGEPVEHTDAVTKGFVDYIN